MNPPYMDVDYTQNQGPTIGTQYPPDNFNTTTTLQPELMVRGSDRDNRAPGGRLWYDFQVFLADGTSNNPPPVAESGFHTSNTFVPPAGARRSLRAVARVGRTGASDGDRADGAASAGRQQRSIGPSSSTAVTCRRPRCRRLGTGPTAAGGRCAATRLRSRGPARPPVLTATPTATEPNQAHP